MKTPKADKRNDAGKTGSGVDAAGQVTERGGMMKREEKFIKRERVADLVLVLQHKASNSSVAVSDLLRRALPTARKLKIIDQVPWIQSELNGYHNADPNSFPPYRFVKSTVECEKSTSSGTEFHDPLLSGRSPSHPNESAADYPCHVSIAEIERALKGKTTDNYVHISCQPNVEEVFIETMKLPSSIVLTVQASRLYRILDAVRNKILDWTSELEEKGISGENMSFSDEPIPPGWNCGKLVLKSVPNGNTPAVFYYGKTATREGITYTVPSGNAWNIVCAMIRVNAFDSHGLELKKSPSDQFKRGHRTFFLQRMGHEGKFWFIRTQ